METKRSFKKAGWGGQKRSLPEVWYCPKIILWFLFLGLFLPVHAGIDVNSEVNQASWREIPYARSASHIITDTDNTLWVGTQGGGVYHFDPTTKHSQTYTRVNNGLADNTIYDMAIDSQKHVWVGTVHGLSVLKNAVWHTLTTKNSGLKSDFITALAVDPITDALWVGTYDTGLYCYDGTTWQHYEIPDLSTSYAFITSIAISKQGEVWVGVWGDGVYRYAQGTWTRYDPSNSSLLSYFVYVKAIDDTGSVWFWCNNDYAQESIGVAALQPRTGEWKKYLIGEAIHSLYADKKGTVWAQSEAFLYQKSGDDFNVVKNIASPMNLNFPNFHLLSEGSEEQLVAGTRDGFVIHHAGEWQENNAPGLAGMRVNDLLIDKRHNKWIATKGGLHKITAKNKMFLFTEVNSPLPSTQINAIAEGADNLLWIGTQAGLAQYNTLKQRWQIFTTANSDLISNKIESVNVTEDGAVWVSFSIYGSGVQCFNGDQWQHFTMQDGLASNTITKITTQKNDVWLQSAQGVSIYKNNHWQKLTQADGLLSNNITSIFPQPHHTWIGTDKGLVKCDGKNMEYFTENLPGLYVTALYEDKSSNLFIGIRDNGLTIFTTTENWEHQTWDEGLTNKRITAITAEKNGSLWLGTEYGMGVYTPQ